MMRSYWQKRLCWSDRGHIAELESNCIVAEIMLNFANRMKASSIIYLVLLQLCNRTTLGIQSLI